MQKTAARIRKNLREVAVQPPPPPPVGRGLTFFCNFLNPPKIKGFSEKEVGGSKTATFRVLLVVTVSIFFNVFLWKEVFWAPRIRVGYIGYVLHDDVTRLSTKMVVVPIG